MAHAVAEIPWVTTARHVIANGSTATQPVRCTRLVIPNKNKANSLLRLKERQMKELKDMTTEELVDYYPCKLWGTRKDIRLVRRLVRRSVRVDIVRF